MKPDESKEANDPTPTPERWGLRIAHAHWARVYGGVDWTGTREEAERMAADWKVRAPLVGLTGYVPEPYRPDEGSAIHPHPHACGQPASAIDILAWMRQSIATLTSRGLPGQAISDLAEMVADEFASSKSAEAHLARHRLLHVHLDELLADYLLQTPGARPSTTTVLELAEWAHAQAAAPTEPAH